MIKEYTTDKLGCSVLSYRLTSHFLLCTDKHSDVRHWQNDLPSTDASFVLVWKPWSQMVQTVPCERKLPEATSFNRVADLLYPKVDLLYPSGWVCRKNITIETHQSCWPRYNATLIINTFHFCLWPTPAASWSILELKELQQISNFVCLQ